MIEFIISRNELLKGNQDIYNKIKISMTYFNSSIKNTYVFQSSQNSHYTHESIM